MFKILKNIIKIILIPFIIFIKALLLISGIIIKILTTVIMFSSILCLGIALGLTCLCSLISILLIVFNFITEKKLPVLTFIIITVLGALCTSIIYFVFYKGIYCVTEIGVLLIEKSFDIPIWNYWINSNQFQMEIQSKGMTRFERRKNNNLHDDGKLKKLYNLSDFEGNYGLMRWAKLQNNKIAMQTLNELRAKGFEYIKGFNHVEDFFEEYNNISDKIIENKTKLENIDNALDYYNKKHTQVYNEILEKEINDLKNKKHSIINENKDLILKHKEYKTLNDNLEIIFDRKPRKDNFKIII